MLNALPLPPAGGGARQAPVARPRRLGRTVRPRRAVDPRPLPVPGGVALRLVLLPQLRGRARSRLSDRGGSLPHGVALQAGRVPRAGRGQGRLRNVARAELWHRPVPLLRQRQNGGEVRRRRVPRLRPTPVWRKSLPSLHARWRLILHRFTRGVGKIPLRGGTNDPRHGALSFDASVACRVLHYACCSFAQLRRKYETLRRVPRHSTRRRCVAMSVHHEPDHMSSPRKMT